MMYPTGKSGQLQPFTHPLHTERGKRYQRMQFGYWERKDGFVEHLLCDDCEQKFSRLESYSKRFLYGDSNPIRLRLPLIPDPLFKADYKQFKLFQLPLLWRASEAKGACFSNISLIDEDREKLRIMLLTESPGKEDEYPCAMGRLVVSISMKKYMEDHGIAPETGLFAPVKKVYEGWTYCTFMMGGVSWIFVVSHDGVPEIMRNSYIKEDGYFWLTNQNGDDFFTQYANKVVAAGNVTKADAEESIMAKRSK